MTIPTIYVTDGKRTILINEADEQDMNARGWARPKPIEPEPEPEPEPESEVEQAPKPAKKTK